MSSIDERVVQMKFDNVEFERRISQTMASLSALNKGLKLEGATKGLDDVNTASSRLTLSPISNALDTLVSKFKTLSIVAITALTNIANRAVNAGITLVKSLSTEPIIAGLHEYETNLNSIQTILANTGLEGQAGLDKVNSALKQLNDYSDQTIYNFSEMARNIGTFTAAGVTLDVATKAIKGIANLAAISGSNAEQASAAMYQLSQAISAGRLTLEDWNSVVNAGLGGKVFQNALIETARVHGIAIDKMIKDEGSFRLTLQKGWLTSNILTETLQKFTGDLTASQLKSMGYTDQQIAGILKMGKTAQEAATKVKTFSQLLSTLQEAAGSGWTQTWQLIFGDFEEARSLFTHVNDVLGGFINASSDARNKVLGDWKELGGRTVIIEAISNAFNALISVVKPIASAFREIFPAVTGKQLYDLTVTIRNFTAGLKIGADTASYLKRTFAGVFAVLGIGWDIVKEGVKLFFSLFGMATKGSGGILEFTARIGDFLVRMREAIQEGRGLQRFFETIGRILAVPIQIIRLFAAAIGSLLDRFDGDAAAKGVENFVSKLSPLSRLTEIGVGAWEKLPGILRDVARNFAPIAEKVGGFFKNLSSAIIEGLRTLDFTKVIGIVQGGLFAGLVASLIAFITKLRSGVGSGQDLLDRITQPFEDLTNTLKAMQNTLRAATLLQIAAAVGILTLSVIGLSKIDSAGLTRALSAITVMFTQLIGALILFEKFGTANIFKVNVAAVALITLAIAIDLLTIAVRNLSSLSWEELARGLTGVTVLIGALVGALNLMPDKGRMISTGLGLLVLAAAIKVLVTAVTDLSGLSWEKMSKGLVGVAGLLGALGLFTRFAMAEKAGIISGVGILLLAAGIKVMASALKDLGQLSWAEIGRGLTAMAGGLVLISAALIAIPPTSIVSAAAVVVIAAALGMVASALQKMGNFSWEAIGKGLVTLAGALVLISAALIAIPPSAIISAAAVLIVALSLGKIAEALAEMGKQSWSSIGKSLTLLAASLIIIAAAVTAMIIALPGAAALLVVAGALAILAPILLLFGKMSWTEIAKGLLTLAGVFAVLGAAGIFLTPLVPTLLGLGAAITLIGIGILAAGAGVLLFSAGLTALSISGAAATVVFVGMVSALLGLLPVLGTQVGLAIIAFAKTISTAGPAILAAFVTIISSLVDAVVTLTPKIVEAVFTLLSKLQDTLLKHVPKLTDTGLQLLVGFLQGIAKNIGKVVTAGTDVVVGYIRGVANNLPRVIQAGIDLIISFVNGLADGIRNNSDRMSDAGMNLASAIIEGMVKGLGKGLGRVKDAAVGVAKSALDSAMNFLGAHSPATKFIDLGEFSVMGFAIGLTHLLSKVSTSAKGVGKTALDTLGGSMSDMSDILSSNMDLQPTIRPVLDLTDLSKNAGQIEKVLAGTRQISLDVARVNASNASIGFQDNRTQTDQIPQTTTGDVTNYTQNNYSPKALSPAEIYRQTKNQLATTKGGLPK